ncbi:MAG: site-specific integrase [Saprospirales bacterium]|nr:site-specific integrase [Saprospirales bacterium]
MNWYIEYYIDVKGKRRRVRRSRNSDGTDLNTITDLAEREMLGMQMVKEIYVNLCPPVIRPEQTRFLEALELAVELKHSNKAKTNKTFTETARWLGEFFHVSDAARPAALAGLSPARLSRHPARRNPRPAHPEYRPEKRRRGFFRRSVQKPAQFGVTIPVQIIPHLAAFHLDQYPENYFIFGRAKGRHNRDFLPGPERVGVNTLSNRFHQVLLRLHREGALQYIKGLSLYSLKDTLALYLLENGVDVESAMRHFRHTSLEMFQRYVKRLGVVNEKIRDLKVELP